MLALFLKIFFTGLFSVLLFLILKKTSSFISRVVNNHSRSSELNQFLSQGIYSEYDTASALKPFVPPLAQVVSPFSKTAVVKNQFTAKKYLTGMVDGFIHQKMKCRYMLILADSGMGKTCFLLNYYFHLKHQKKERALKVTLVPLRLKMSDQMIGSVPDPNHHILLLDGLNEDVKALGDPHKRMRELIDMTRKFKRVVITATPHFIPRLSHLPKSREYEIIEPEDIKDSTIYRLNRVYMSRLRMPDVKNHLRHLFSFWNPGNKGKIVKLIQERPYIPINPLVLRFLKEISVGKLSILSLSEIYEAYIRISEKGKQSNIERLKIRQILGMLAREQYLSGIHHGEQFFDKKTIAEMTGDSGLDPHFFDKQTKFLISRAGKDCFVFNHPSIMEYLFVQQLFKGDTACDHLPLTGMMKRFLFAQIDKNQQGDLKTEFKWLSAFDLRFRGISNDESSLKTAPLLNVVLKTDKQYTFLKKLDALFQNPIFFEFGWNTSLAENIRQAIFDLKPSLMKFKNEDCVVNIQPRKIEIRRAHKKKVQLLINKKDFQEYDALKGQPVLLNLFSAVDLNGLKMIRNINRSDSVALLADPDTGLKFTICLDLGSKS